MENTLTILITLVIVTVVSFGLIIAILVMVSGNNGTSKEQIGEKIVTGERIVIGDRNLVGIEETMDAIAKRVGTDKVNHGFTKYFYPIHFHKLRYNKVKMLEIGLFHGDSVHLWTEYFEDLDMNVVEYKQDYIDNEKLRFPEVKFTNVNMENIEDIKQFVQSNEPGSFDIVLDDGGHTMKQQINALVHMISLVKPGGMFVMEDVHTSFLPLAEQYGVQNKDTYMDTTLNVIQAIIGRRPNASVSMNHISESELNYLRSKVKGGESYLYNGHGTVVLYII